MKKNTIIIISIILFILLFCFVQCEGKSNNKEVPTAVNGFLDLSDWENIDSGIVKLNGQWEFYWKELLNPADFKKSNTHEKKSYIIVPKRWDYLSDKKKNITTEGYATYRLKVRLNKRNNSGALRIPNIFSSYKLWIDDELYLESGKPGKTRKETTPKDLPRIIFFNYEHNEFFITIAVSNFHDNPGGICFPIIFGDAHVIQKEKMKRENFDIFLFGAILILAFFHFGLFILRKKEKPLLFFSLFCLIIALRGMVTGEHVLLNYIPFLNYEFQKKIEFFALSFGVMFFSTFLFTQYPREMSKSSLGFFLISGGIYSIIIAFTPLRIYCRILIFFQIIIVLTCLHTFYILIKAVIKKRDGAIIFISGFLILFISVFAEILQDRLKIEVGYYIPFGLLVFLIAQAFILAKKFSSAFFKVENYSIELEAKVKERTNQLEKVNREKTDFFINIAHETKTPLTLINNYLGAYIKKIGISYELKIIKNNFDKLLNNMIDFLDLEKIQKGKIIYDHNQLINVSDFLENKIVLFEEFAKNKNIKIHTYINKRLFIKIDPKAFDRIINNLIENAVRYTPSDGEIFINLIEKDNKILFIVRDTGVGLTDDQISNIFEPYYQIPTEQRVFQGLGMGLGIVKQIVESVNAEIIVRSKIETGTSFIVKFKKQKLNKNKVTVNPVLPINNTYIMNTNLSETIFKNGRYNIFIIEDNIDLISYLIKSMEDKFNIYYSFNGKEALNKIENIPKPHLILSDVMMDKMNGFDFYDKLLLNKSFNKIPFIFITAKMSYEEKIANLKKGAVDYIYKPFVVEELIAKIESLLKIHDETKKENLLKISDKLFNLLDMADNLQSGKLIINKNDNMYSHQMIYKYGISKREVEVISLIKEGFEYKEIAIKLSISLYTVKTYVRRIYEKCHVNNKIDLLNIFNK